MIKLLTILAEGFEETEAVTVIDLLRRVDINVTVCGLNSREVKGSHGISIKCDCILDEIDSRSYDGLFLAGGQPGTENLKKDVRVIELVKVFDTEKKWLTAICAAPLVFNKAGILRGRKVTSYPSEKTSFTTARYIEDRVVHDGHIITSRGVGTAIEFSLFLVGVILGEKKKQDLAVKILWFG